MKLLAVVLSSCVLVACGGGGGSSAPTTSTSTLLTVTGTAATGLAIPGATITGKCKVGSGTATTLTDGSYTLAVTDGQLPCILQITNPVDGIKLHTVVTGTGSTANANITPLTEMATARVLGSEPNVFFAAFDAAVATQKITANTVQAAQTDIGLVLTGTVETASLGNFISAPLKAATQGSPTSGDAHDKLLDALKLKLSSVQVGTLTTALASNKTTNAIKQTIASMTSAPTTPPIANAGFVQSVVTGMTVILDASASSAATGKALTYAWTLTAKPAGSAATLVAPTTAKPTFVADVAGSFVASVIVNDGTTASSAVAVTVTASAANAAPVANAGAAQSVVAGFTVTLNGAASTDANRDALTYAWTLTSTPPGSAAALTNATAVALNFVADKAGTYVAMLVVNDGKLSSAAATITVSAAAANVASGKIPDSGITSIQCYAAGSDALVSCTSAAALALNDQQDGMVGLDVSTPDSSNGKLGFNYTKLDADGYALPANSAIWVCVKDNITGLTWEIKTADGGARDRYKTYTNYDDNRSSDASGFAAAVNGTKLCGHADWRVPTILELQGIVDYSKDYTVPGDGPSIDSAWFINTIAYNYWSSSAFAGDASLAWNVDFKCGVVGYCSRSALYAVRLVR